MKTLGLLFSMSFFTMVMLSCSSPSGENSKSGATVNPNDNVCDTKFYDKNDLILVAQQAHRISQNCNLDEEKVVSILSK